MAQHDLFKDISDEENFRIARNRTVDKAAKTDYYITIIVECQSKRKKLWGYMGELTPI